MKTDTPRTDEVAWPETGLVEGDFARQLERELTAARAEIERLDTAGIHSCHKDCQRPNCVLRRELKAVTEQRDEARYFAEGYRNRSWRPEDNVDANLLPWETTNPNEL